MYQALCNFRTLAGILGEGGRVREAALYRSADLTRGDALEARRLVEELGIRTYVDLRSAKETLRSPPTALLAAGVRWVKTPMDLVDGDFWRNPSPQISDWAALYERGLQRHREELKEALSEMAASDGAVVFGCWIGKDRTGVLSALLLSCLGVADDLIIADYARSTEGLSSHLDRFAVLWGEDPAARERIVASYFFADPEIMRALLTDVRARFGGLPAAVGVDDDLGRALRARFLSP